MQGSANLNLMIKAARRAGKSLVKDFREVENLQVSTKGPGDFVSKADREAERLIKEDLMGARPTYGWLGEETGGEDGADPTRRWIVDPLDGTTNFLHGMPHWAVSIALEHKGEIVSAVVFDAAKDELFWAEKGAGAWCNDKRMRVSGRRNLHEAVFATGVPFGAKSTLPATLQDLARLMPACAGVRRWGAHSFMAKAVRRTARLPNCCTARRAARPKRAPVSGWAACSSSSRAALVRRSARANQG